MYMIVTTHNIHIPGDQRSIEAPGHGYPAHYEEVNRIEEIDNKEAFIKRITKLHKDGESFKCYEAKLLQPKFDIVVDV